MGLKLVIRRAGVFCVRLQKAHVRAYTRKTGTGKIVQVSEHDDKRKKAEQEWPVPHPMGLPHAANDPGLIARIKAQHGVVVPPRGWGLKMGSPKGNLPHVLAHFFDAKGRTQYIYHPDFTRHRTQAKFDSLQQVERAIPKIDAWITANIGKIPAREGGVAAILRLIRISAIRIGSERYAAREDAPTMGACTLNKANVSLHGDTVTIDFVGKHHKAHLKAIPDAGMARAVRALMRLPGDRLFQAQGPDGVTHITSSEVYSVMKSQWGISPKSFRTYEATRMASSMLLAMPQEPDRAKREKNVTAVCKEVAEHLGNTPACCRKNYINPAVINAYIEGYMENREEGAA